MKPSLAGGRTSLVLLASGIVLLLPAYGLGLMLLGVLPIALAANSFSSERCRRGARSVAADLAIALVVVPLALLGVLAPLRSLLVAALSLHPVAIDRFHEAHAPLYGLLRPLFGPASHGWLDFWWGAFGVAALLAMAIVDRQRRSLLAREIAILPTARVRSVAVGLVELSGRAVPLEGRPGDRPILHRWFDRTSRAMGERTRLEPFYLDDGTGRLLVDPTGAHVQTAADGMAVDLRQVRLARRLDSDGLPEAVLMPGDPVLVIGTVQLNRDPATREAHPLVLRPRKPSLARLEYFDLFFVGVGTERELLGPLRRSIHRGWGGTAAAMAITALLPVGAWTNLVQMQALDVAAAPPLLRTLAPPTLMEREIGVPGSGRAPVVAWLRRLQEPRHDKHLIVAALRPLGLAHRAVPVLAEAVRDLEHPDFGAAHRWLPSLGAYPVGLWGCEYADPALESGAQTRVFRVLLERRGDRLLASYIVHLNESEPINQFVAARKVELVFRSAATGEEHVVPLAATPGWNRAKALELPGRYPRGTYAFRITTRREFSDRRFGAYDRERDPAPEARFAL